MTDAEVVAALRARLSPPRAAHSERVAQAAEDLACRHGLDAAQARLAGLLHDWCRELPLDETLALGREFGLGAGVPAVLHGPIAARLLPRIWPELPQPVLGAIDRHTTGDPEMTPLDCAVYLADLLEPEHAFAGVDALRALAAADLLAATLAAMDTGLRHLLDRGRAIDGRTVAARNALLVRASGTAAPGRRS